MADDDTAIQSARIGQRAHTTARLKARVSPPERWGSSRESSGNLREELTIGATGNGYPWYRRPKTRPLQMARARRREIRRRARVPSRRPGRRRVVPER